MEGRDYQTISPGLELRRNDISLKGELVSTKGFDVYDRHGDRMTDSTGEGVSVLLQDYGQWQNWYFHAEGQNWDARSESKILHLLRNIYRISHMLREIRKNGDCLKAVPEHY